MTSLPDAQCNDLLASAGEGYRPAPRLGLFNAAGKERMDAWRKVTGCPACTADTIAPFSVIRHIRYDRCRRCGFTFANPIPSDETLKAFYNSPYYNNYRRLEAERIRDAPYFSVSYHDLPRLAAIVDGFRPRSILDFGAGPGSFLAMLRDGHGYENVEGLELNEASASVAQRSYGLRLAADVRELRSSTYDMVALVEVIEHLPLAGGIFSVVADLVRPDGYLFITTDSIGNLPSRYFPAHSGHYTGPSHISLFTETALVEFLKRHGFTIVRMETDRCDRIVGDAVVSAFYDLDFSSPQSRGDVQDAVFIPARLGRVLRFSARRSPWDGPAGTLLKALRRLDSVAGRLINRAAKRPFSDHLFVVARKQDHVEAPVKNAEQAALWF